MSRNQIHMHFLTVNLEKLYLMPYLLQWYTIFALIFILVILYFLKMEIFQDGFSLCLQILIYLGTIVLPNDS
jgi:hypothetical protein